jgi:hypothetical protein
MKIIGVGFGRTGTMSTWAALEHLGYKPCYHFLEVFKRPSHIRTWQAAADGEEVDWRKFLGGYQAALDYPIPAFYKELIEACPEAKVLLTVRDPEKWYASTYQTIYQGFALPDWLLNAMPAFRGMKKMGNATTWDGLFHGKFEDREYAIRIFEEHIQEVQRVVPADRLLVFRVQDGWKPLCEFLGVAEPGKRFPHLNDRKTTQRIYAVTRIGAPLLALFAVALLIWLIVVILF